MAVTCTGTGRDLTIAISGEVDHHGAGEIMREMDRQLNAGLPKRVTLDLGGVTFMDSSGIAVVLRAQKYLMAQGGALSVRHIPHQADKVLRAAGLDRLIRFEPEI